MKKLSKILGLPYQEKVLLAQSLFLVVIIRLSLWVFPIRWINRSLSRFKKFVSDKQKADWILIKNVTSSVSTSSYYVPCASCLTQALATQTLLRIRGQESVLKIGVDKDESGKLLAHAWIEVAGEIIIGKLPHHHRFNVLSYSGSITV